MIYIHVPQMEFYDGEANEFFIVKEQTLAMEHSLLSVDKWESKTKTPFASKSTWTNDELIDYMKCMTITKNVDPLAYLAIPQSEIKRVQDYIKDPMTATTFNKNGKKDDKQSKTAKNGHNITSEEIYYLMTAYQIPLEFEKRHFNKLLTLIRVCELKNADPKKNKMNRNDIYSKYRDLNNKRKAAMHSKG